MKRNMFGALMTLIVAFTVAVPVVHAQTILSASVPFAFSVDGKLLPAGDYQIRDYDRATLITNRDGNFKVLGIYAYAGPSKLDENKLVFRKVGDHYFLYQIWTSARGQGLAVPEPKTEKEMEASNHQALGGTETVIVALR
jgi:hypothetical protein